MKLRRVVTLVLLLASPAMAQNFGQIPGHSVIGNPGSVYSPAAPFDWGALPRGSLIDAAADYGAVCDGTTNTTTQIQNAINAAQAGTSGKGIVLLPAGTCVITPPLTIIATMWLLGQGRRTVLRAIAGSSANLINVGYQASEIYGVRISDLMLQGNSATGGYAVSVKNAALTTMSRVYVDNTFCGIEDYRTNYETYENIYGYTRGNNCAAFYWHGDADNTSRSDSLNLHNIAFNNGYYGNDGFVWDGMANTLQVQNMVMLESKHGFWARNTAGSNSWFPQFASIYNLQIEGAQVAACEIDSGRGFYFTDGWCHSQYGQTGPGGNQGNNDTAALVINPDAGAGVTGDVKFANMSIGLSAHAAASIHAQGIAFSNISFRGSSLSAANAYPSLQINGGNHYALSNMQFCGTFGDVVQNSYGLVIGGAVGAVQLVNGNFNYCQTGEISGSPITLVVVSSIARDGTVLTVQ